MAAQNFLFKSFKYAGVSDTDEGLVLPYREANSQSFVAGDLVVLNAGGDISLATAGGANQILGVANAAATNVTSGNKLIPVQIIRKDDLFMAHYVAAATFVITMLGENHEIVRTAAGNWEVAAGTTAADARVKVINTMEYTSDGVLSATAGGPILVRFLQADSADQVLQFGTDASI